MRDKGFISNRLFDGFAAGAFIISDKIEGYENVFGDALVIYETPEELHKLINYYLNNEHERSEKVKEGKNKVMAKYTFQKKVEYILEVLNEK